MKSAIRLLSIACMFFSLNIQADNFDAVKKSGKLKVAVDTTYPPMEFESVDGKITGLDVDLAKALAKELGVEAEFVVMPWDGILAGLQSNRYDIIMSSMNVTPDRQKQVDFVEYVKMGQVFVVKKTAKPVKSEAELAGLVVAVQADTTSFEAVEGFKKSGIAIKDVKAFKGATEAFQALKAGQADAIVIDEAVGFYYAGLDSKTFLVSGNALKPEPIGIAVKKTDKKLHTELTKALAAIKKNGSFKRIYKEWLKTEPKF